MRRVLFADTIATSAEAMSDEDVGALLDPLDTIIYQVVSPSLSLSLSLSLCVCVCVSLSRCAITYASGGCQCTNARVFVTVFVRSDL